MTNVELLATDSPHPKIIPGSPTGSECIDPAPLTSENTKSKPEAVNGQSEDEYKGQHPALKKMCVVESNNCQVIVPNSEPVEIDTDLFDGLVMLMIRTPDVDDEKDATKLEGYAKHSSDHFKQFKRRFEFQFQIKFKKLPTGPLFMGCELENALRLSKFSKGLVNVLMALIQKKHNGFHFSWGTEEPVDPKKKEEGNYEKTHLAFPVECFMDIIQITKPGGELPRLGKDALFETQESFKKRRKAGVGALDWNLEDTYSMCLYSAYMDWIQWKALNLPVKAFPVDNLLGPQPIYMSVYEMPAITRKEYKKKKPSHYRKDLCIYTRLELSNYGSTKGGLVQRLESEGKIKHRLESSGTESIKSDS